LDGDDSKPALPGARVGDVGDPQPIWGGSHERPIGEVIADPNARDPGRCLAALAGDQPEIPAWRMSRSTRLRPSFSPSAMTSSAWILGDP
jgi:hypothetical protein